ncbi:MAG: hypothetical protein HQ527_02205 [Cyanobacteria bacterium]|nr:hypothetical protein [Cyanobacteria bacterium bin.51]
MQPAPSIEELCLERPDLSDEQLIRRECSLRLLAQSAMTGFAGVLTTLMPPGRRRPSWRHGWAGGIPENPRTTPRTL